MDLTAANTYYLHSKRTPVTNFLVADGDILSASNTDTNKHYDTGDQRVTACLQIPIQKQSEKIGPAYSTLACCSVR